MQRSKSKWRELKMQGGSLQAPTLQQFTKVAVGVVYLQRKKACHP
jgi:hypothetical protein